MHTQPMVGTDAHVGVGVTAVCQSSGNEREEGEEMKQKIRIKQICFFSGFEKCSFQLNSYIYAGRDVI